MKLPVKIKELRLKYLKKCDFLSFPMMKWLLFVTLNELKYMKIYGNLTE